MTEPTREDIDNSAALQAIAEHLRAEHLAALVLAERESVHHGDSATRSRKSLSPCRVPSAALTTSEVWQRQ